MTKNFAFVAVALLALPFLLAAGSDPEPTAQPKPAPRGGAHAVADVALDEFAVAVALGEQDAQQKVEQFLQSHQAHRQAIASLQQCQNCHGGSAANWAIDTALAMQPQGPWIGVSVGPADGVLRSQLRLPDGTGVVVTDVVANGPAAQAGVAAHDVLLSIDGKPVASSEDLERILHAAEPGRGLLLKLMRAGQALEMQVAPSKPDRQVWVETVLDAAQQTYRIGVEVADPDETLKKQLRLEDGGVVVTSVYPGRPAEAAGLKAGDVLLSAGGRKIKKQEELTEAVQAAAGSPMALEVMRGGVTLKLSATPVTEAAHSVVGLANTFLLDAHMNQPRQLMLVQPGEAQALGDWIGWARTRPAGGAPAADRVEEMGRQIEQLRQAVEGLRAELKAQGGRREAAGAEGPAAK